MGAFYFDQIITSVEPLIVAKANYKLFQNYPNPFNELTVISYTLEVSARVSLEIYNMQGQEVWTLVDENQQAGKHSVVWDGENNSGNAVEPGVYFYQLKTAINFSKTKRMILLK
ncbi:MAG: T9SS type A sorting domain-containing protein, partial [Candidatus Cloacimonetes bacterium]|nr:T9SS type A sorting domain-containing protein [Candidatus Cloacimonadota bacterium]